MDVRAFFINARGEFVNARGVSVNVEGELVKVRVFTKNSRSECGKKIKS